MKSKFDFYEYVRVKSEDEECEDIQNKVGLVLGKGQNDNGAWSYTVGIEDHGAWDLCERELVLTGKKGKREDWFSEESIRVGITEAGEGRLIEDEETPDR